MVLMSGVNDVTSEVFEHTNSYMHKELEPPNDLFLVIPVERIAGIYSQNLIKFLENRRDTICQARTGLRYQDFLKKHQDWPQALQEDIINEINDEPGTQTIVTGIDQDGAHIYLIDDRGSVSCKDSIGFAVIGSGSLHAHSQLMQSRHSSNASYYDTLFLAYMAKKQAELDKYVGKDTDIFVIKDDTNYDILPHKTVKALEDIYESTYNKMFAEAKTKIAAYLKDK